MKPGLTGVTEEESAVESGRCLEMSNCLIPVVRRGVTLADIFMALVCWLPFEHSSILPFASKAGGRTEFTLLFRGEK